MKGKSKAEMLTIQYAKGENLLRMSHSKVPHTHRNSSQKAFQRTMEYKSMKATSKTEMQTTQYAKA
jgi:hypothetical protein